MLFKLNTRCYKVSFEGRSIVGVLSKYLAFFSSNSANTRHREDAVACPYVARSLASANRRSRGTTPFGAMIRTTPAYFCPKLKQRSSFVAFQFKGVILDASISGWPAVAMHGACPGRKYSSSFDRVRSHIVIPMASVSNASSLKFSTFVSVKLFI
jgi:hypothetical protein